MNTTTTTTKRNKKGAAVCDRSLALKIAKACGSCDSMESFAAILSAHVESFPAHTHWHKYGKKLIEWVGNYKTAKKTPFRVFSRKNSKLPFVNFSALPLITCPGAGACATFCYSLKAWRYPAAFYRQIQNTLLIRFDLARIANDFARLKKLSETSWSVGDIDTVRLYVDGDFDSQRTVSFWFDLCKLYPNVNFYGYSKSWDIIRNYSGEYPKNYTLNLSSGGKQQTATVADMLALPITRGRYVAVPVDENLIVPERYSLPEYHAAVRESGESNGYGRVFSCPGECGNCVKLPNGKNSHACGDKRFSLVVIANGIH